MIKMSSAKHNRTQAAAFNITKQISDNPIIPFIEGDGIGKDIWQAAMPVIDAAIVKAYDGNKKIIWKEVYAGQKAYDKFGTWLPDETLNAFKEHLIGIKRPPGDTYRRRHAFS